MTNATMNRESWQRCTDTARMLFYLEKRRFEDRKLRLFACACCRLIWEYFTDMRSRHAIETSELYADCLVSRDVLINAMERADDIQGDEIVVAASMAAGTDAVGCALEVLCLVETKIDAARCADLLRDIIPDPFTRKKRFYSRLKQDKALLAHQLSEQMYMNRQFLEMPQLANILINAGCLDETVLSHCRHYPLHARGCWVIDECLGK